MVYWFDIIKSIHTPGGRETLLELYVFVQEHYYPGLLILVYDIMLLTKFLKMQTYFRAAADSRHHYWKT